MMKTFLVLLLSLSSVAFAAQDEELFMRRIVEFWRDHEYGMVKKQVTAFFEAYPESQYTDHFQGMLGDVALREKEYRKAIAFYDKISDRTLRKEVRGKRWHALYQLGEWRELHEEAGALLPFLDEECRFYYAEGLFREGLALHREGKEGQRFWEEALPHYEMLLSSGRYALHVKMALAEICRLLGESRSAAAYYSELATLLEEQGSAGHEEVLYHAAGMLSQFDQERALHLFSKLTEHQTEMSRPAAAQWLSLLAKRDAFDEIAEHKELFFVSLPVEKQPHLHFYLGQAFYHQENFENARLHFEKGIEKGLEPELEKVALQALLVSARKSGKLDSLERALVLLEKKYVKDEAAMIEGHYLRAQAHLEAGHDEKALVALNTLLNLYGNRMHEAILAAFIEKAKLLGNQEAVDHRGVAAALENALEMEALLPVEKREKIQLLLAKAYYDQGSCDKALALLERTLLQFGPSAQTHYLLTLTALRAETHPEKVVAHGEEALRLAGGDEKIEELRLHLFNAYVDLAKANPHLSYEEKAIEHLFAAFDRFPLSLDNHVWLAHTLFEKADGGRHLDQAKRARFLFEALFERNDLDPYCELERLKLAAIYGWFGESGKQREWLEALREMQTSCPHRHWKHIPETELALANLYNELGEKTKALRLYTLLEKGSDLSTAYAARLQRARLVFEALPPEAPEAEEILSTLKDLQVHKTLANEPTHLEAALDFAYFSAENSPDKESRLLTLLVEMKEDFTAREDIWSKDYHASRELMPAKNRIYQAYMRLLDASILALQADRASLEGRRVEAQTLEKAALSLFSSLCEGDLAVSKYLVDRASEELKQR